jgi:hypothetical protein
MTVTLILAMAAFLLLLVSWARGERSYLSIAVLLIIIAVLLGVAPIR